MERKLLVPTVVVFAAIAGMITIVPIAMADRDDDDDDDDEKTCMDWFFKAYTEFIKKDFVPAGIKHKVLECIEDGHESPWELPDMGNPQQPSLTGLNVEFVETSIEIPVSPGSPLSAVEEVTEVHPCPSGEIVIGDLHVVSVGSKTSMKLELQDDKTTLILKTTNKDTTPDTLVLLTPCLGLIGN